MPAWRQPGPSLTKLRLSPRMVHSAAVSADRHIKPHGISIYAPALRIPRSLGHRRVAPHVTVRRQVGWARGHAHFKGTSAGGDCSRELGAAALLGALGGTLGGIVSRIV